MERIPSFLSSPMSSDSFVFDGGTGRFIYIERRNYESKRPILIIYDVMFNEFM